MIPNHDLQSLLLVGAISTPCSNIPLSSIVASLEVWKALLKHTNTKNSRVILDIPLRAYKHLLPSLNVSMWLRKGLFTYRDLIELSVGTLDYSYLWLRNFHCTHPSLGINMDTKLWQYLNQQNPSKGGISWFYNYFQQSEPFTKSTQILNWERDFFKSFSAREWQL